MHKNVLIHRDLGESFELWKAKEALTFVRSTTSQSQNLHHHSSGRCELLAKIDGAAKKLAWAKGTHADVLRYHAPQTKLYEGPAWLH